MLNDGASEEQPAWWRKALALLWRHVCLVLFVLAVLPLVLAHFQVGEDSLPRKDMLTAIGVVGVICLSVGSTRVASISAPRVRIRVFFGVCIVFFLLLSICSCVLAWAINMEVHCTALEQTHPALANEPALKTTYEYENTHPALANEPALKTTYEHANHAWKTASVIHTLSLAILTVPTVAMIVARHPPSNYIRCAVWLCALLWFDAFANVLGQPCHCWDQSWFCLFHASAVTLTFRMTCGWCVILLCLRRAAALENAFGGAAKLGKGVFTLTSLYSLSLVVVLLGALSRPEAVSWAVISVLALVAVTGVHVTIVLLIMRVYREPLEVLRAEAPLLSGPMRLEACNSLFFLKVERIAVVAMFAATMLRNTMIGLEWMWSALQADDLIWVRTSVQAAMALEATMHTYTVAVLSGMPLTARAGRCIFPSSAYRTKSRRSQDELHVHANRPQRGLEWKTKVEDLAHRAISLRCLFDFYFCLGSQNHGFMPQFDPERSTTHDVVRQAIIPLSYLGILASGEPTGGLPMTMVMQQKQEPAQRMVTHNWGNLFRDLVAAVVADGLGDSSFEQVAKDLTARKFGDLRKRLRAQGALGTTYWICAFSVNQHASICASFPPAPAEDTPAYRLWDDKRRDTVTGEVHPLCNCSQPKFFNDHPFECEMDKFDDMMAYLSTSSSALVQVVAIDSQFELFGRAWCIAELVQADACGIQQHVKISSRKALLDNYERILKLDIRDCGATRPEDKETIIAKLPRSDIDAFNRHLVELICGPGGILRSCMDGEARLAGVGMVASAFRERSDTAMTNRSTSSPSPSGAQIHV